MSSARDGRPRQKSLGQYFTDQRVAVLLANEATASQARRIADPMVGTGNLLAACLEVGAVPDYMCGVEIDPSAANIAKARFEGHSNVEIISGDSFQHDWLKDDFDLVITNPPFVRNTAKTSSTRCDMPSQKKIRSSLVSIVQRVKTSSPQDRSQWLKAVRSYPGNSDLAVPSLILCSALVSPGGALAMVAPTTWLQRPYANAFRELIESEFSIESIIEDGDASWFADAQVRTQLVICRRNSPSKDIPKGQTNYIRLTKKFWEDQEGSGLIHPSHASKQLENSSLRAQNHSGPLSHDLSSKNGLRELNGSKSLLDYGWSVGQGLRSGANEFFYVTNVGGRIEPHPLWNIKELDVPEECLRPAVWRQNQLVEGYSVQPQVIHTAILDLNGWVTNQDSRLFPDGEFKILPPTTSKWIEQVSHTLKQTNGRMTPYPLLTAVSTNKKIDQNGKLIRSWYHLPPFKRRHSAPLLMPRVNGDRPKTQLNASSLLVDANFSTFWPSSANAIPTCSVLAMLNSSWTWFALEKSCHVLGGGALKVEAANIRSLPFPSFSGAQLETLDKLGARLVAREDTLPDIDRIFDEAISAGNQLSIPELLSEDLRTVATRFLSERRY